MFGKCSSGIKSNSGKLRLPSPVFAVPKSHLSVQPKVQQNEFGQNSGYTNDINKPEFSQSNNQSWMNGSAQGQSNRKDRFAKPIKQKFQRPRNFYNAYQPRGRGNSSFYCDSCDRGFSTLEEYQYHCSNEHITCGLDGCTLSAHPKVVEKHQKIQHLSGLYLRLMSNSSKNPEDVAKWIAERKKNYPTRANIERRKEVEKERLERGETLEPDRRRFGRFGDRGRQWGMRGRGGKSIGRDRKQHRKHTQSKEGCALRGKRGRGRSGSFKTSERISKKVEKLPAKEEINLEWEDKKGIPMFCGTATLFGIPLKKDESSDEEMVEDEVDFSDSEWLMDDGAAECKDAKKDENGCGTDGSPSKPKKDTVVLNNALGLLIGTYGSDDSNSDEEDTRSENKPPAKRMCMGNKGDTQQNPQTGTLPLSSEEKTTVSSSASKTLAGETMNVEEDSDGSAPEVECIKKGPVDNVISTVKMAVESVKVEEDSDDSPPEVVSSKIEPREEVKIQKEDEKKNEDEKNEKKEVRKEDEGKKRVRRSRKRGRTRGGKGDGKKGLEEENGQEDDESRVMREKKQLELNQTQRYPTLLEELLKDDIRRERNAILQCIRYVVENNFFDKVEEIPPKEIVPEEKAVISRDSKSNSSELHDGNLHSENKSSDEGVMMKEPIDKKHENALPSLENNDCEMKEPSSCGQNECNVEKGNSHEVDSSSQEDELKEKAELGKETGCNTLRSKDSSDLQSKDASKLKDGGSSESPQEESKDTIDCKTSSAANNENVLGTEGQSCSEINPVSHEEKKSLENTISNCETRDHVSASPKSNDVQLSNNFCQKDEVISKENDESPKSAMEQDKGSIEGHDASISVEGDVKKPEFSSLKGSEDTESLKISSEEEQSNVAKVETITDAPVKELEESKGNSAKEVVQSLEIENVAPPSDGDLKHEVQECD